MLPAQAGSLFSSGNGWKISLISLPSTLLPVNLPIAADDMTRPVKTKKAARTNEKYMSCASFDFLVFLGGSSSFTLRIGTLHCALD